LIGTLVFNDVKQMPDNFEFVEFTTADDLLDAIVPIPRLRTKTPDPEFVFRGQGDTNWLLAPSAMRKNKEGVTGALSKLGDGDSDDQADMQVFAEFRLLSLFVEACDKAVIAIPGDGREFREVWLDDQKGPMESRYRLPATWPAPEHYAALAFAQHHGIPTRLLDWTRNALVAAYFAADDAIKARTTTLAVWALNIRLIHLYERIAVVKQPGANSARLGAQRGLFTIVRQQSERGGPNDHSRLDEALTSKNENTATPKPLWKLTLPSTEARRLLFLCHLHGVDGSTVYPGPAGAALAALERLEWAKNDPNTGFNAETMRDVARIDIDSQRKP
jgi:hypothetical protein